MATSGWNQALVIAKVMTILKDPALIALDRPTRTYLCGSGPGSFITTNWITLGVVNTPMVGNIYYQATMDKFLSKKRKYDNQPENWDKNNAKGYCLVMQHCPKELEKELRNQYSRKTAKDARSGITILLLIGDLSFNKT